MVDIIQPSALAAADEAPPSSRVHVPGAIVSAGAAHADEPTSAHPAPLGVPSSFACPRAGATGVDGTGAPACCGKCFDERAAARAGENAGAVEDAA